MEALTPVKLINNYEAIVMLDLQTTEDEQKTIFKKNQEIIKGFSGEVNHLDTWGRRSIANPIEKKTHAFYFHTTFTSEAGSIAELERTMKINDKVLRFMHVRLDNRKPIAKHLEEFREVIAQSDEREKEREAKFQKKRAARQARPPRSDSRDRSDSRS